MAGRERPTGITILSVLYGLGGVGSLIGGLAFVAFGAIVALSEELFFPAFPPELTGGFGALFVFLGILFVGAAWGLWKGRGWARTFSVVLTVIGILVGLGLAPFTAGASVLGILINLAIIYYLTRPHVKAFFAPVVLAPTPPYVPPPPPSYTPPSYVPPPPPPSAGGVQPKIFCAQCGVENATGAIFCKSCGARIVS